MNLRMGSKSKPFQEAGRSVNVVEEQDGSRREQSQGASQRE